MSTTHFGELSVSRFELMWVLDVKDFNSKEVGEYIKSPVFFANDKKQAKFSLSFYPKGTVDSSKGHAGLFLMNKNDFDIKLEYLNLSLLTNSNVKINKKEFLNVEVSSKKGSGEDNFVRESKLFGPANGFIVDDKITIVCLIVGQMVISESYKQNDLWKVNEKLFTNNIHTDITIICNEKKFCLNKCILAARSSVFEAMLTSDMVEKERNVIEINDTDSDVLYQFFKYLYTNTVDNLNKIAKDLLVVADKYLVSDLKDECKEVLCGDINLGNALEYFRIADMYHVKDLKRTAIKFIARHITEFTNRPEFKSLDQEKLLAVINKHVYYMKKNKK